MTSIFISLTAITFLMVQSQRSFVDTAPTSKTRAGSPEVVPQYQDDTVRELENLKDLEGKSLQMMKTHAAVYTNINGQKEAHSHIKEQLNENGKLIASLGQRLDESPGPDGDTVSKLRTKVDIPSKGIHKTMVQQLDPQQIDQQTENGNRRASNVQVYADPNNILSGFILPNLYNDALPTPANEEVYPKNNLVPNLENLIIQ